MFNLGIPELMVIAGVALLLFGANRIPEVAKALGRSVNAFKSGLKEAMSDVDETKGEVNKLPDESQK